MFMSCIFLVKRIISDAKICDALSMYCSIMLIWSVWMPHWVGAKTFSFPPGCFVSDAATKATDDASRRSTSVTLVTESLVSPGYAKCVWRPFTPRRAFTPTPSHMHLPYTANQFPHLIESSASSEFHKCCGIRLPRQSENSARLDASRKNSN